MKRFEIKSFVHIRQDGAMVVYDSDESSMKSEVLMLTLLK